MFFFFPPLALNFLFLTPLTSRLASLCQSHGATDIRALSGRQLTTGSSSVRYGSSQTYESSLRFLNYAALVGMIADDQTFLKFCLFWELPAFPNTYAERLMLEDGRGGQRFGGWRLLEQQPLWQIRRSDALKGIS